MMQMVLERSKENLANACPFEAGPGVYHARGVLMAFTGKVYHNACETYTSPAPVKSALRIKSLAVTEEKIQIYPNPAKDVLFINLNLDLENKDKTQISLIDINGRLVGDQDILRNGLNTIKTDQLSKGIYFIQIRVNGSLKATEKLIIE